MIDAASQAISLEWSKIHETQNRLLLTGSTFASTMRTLGVAGRIKSGQNVLEIGVGFGFSARGLDEMGCRVSVLDVCAEAFRCVEGIAAGTYLHETCNAMPSRTFDWALSLLVTQHMSDTDILWQFPHVFRSLKDDGIFATQWAGSTIPGENDCLESIIGTMPDPEKVGGVDMLSGRMVRSHKHAQTLIDRSGGEVLSIGPRRDFPEYKAYWFTTESRRAR